MVQSSTDIDLFDSISGRHFMLRRKTKDMCNANQSFQLSNSEWFLISKIHNNEYTISHLSKLIFITRQATHKLLKGLAAQNIVSINNVSTNKKEKYVVLTTLGEKLYVENTQFKKEIEIGIRDAIGDENVEKLKELLSIDWKM